MKRLRLISGLIILVVSCAPALEKGTWAPDTYDALSALLKDKANRGGYAVFDCDNTSIIHDVTHTLTLYMVENLRFADAPEHLFVDGLGETDFPLEGCSVSAAQWGTDLRDRYRTLKSMQEAGTSLDSLQRTDLFRDWRGRFMAFYEALGRSYDYGTLCLWEPLLTEGYTDRQLQALGRESIRYWLSQGKVWHEELVSTDGQYHGKGEKGLMVLPEMKALYKALEQAGIRPYICSASVEWLVEIFACDSEIGFGLSPDQVFGIRLAKDADGGYVYDPTYVQPFKEGKVSCIDSLIAPQHGGRQPVLVAGDSSGDIAMLTAYPEMKVGLIMNRFRGGEIEALADRHDGRYFSQPVFIPELPPISTNPNGQ